MIKENYFNTLFERLNDRNFNELISIILAKSLKSKKTKKIAKKMISLLLIKVNDADTSENAQKILCFLLTETQAYKNIFKKVEFLFEVINSNDKNIQKSALKVVKNFIEKEKDFQGVDDES